MSFQRCIGPCLVTLAVLFTAVLSLAVGRYPVSPAGLAGWLLTLFGHGGLAAGSHPPVASVVLDARLPRVLAAMLVGAGLSVAGGAYQAVFRNPLVSPGLLGVLSGCAFGAALGIVLGLHGLWVPALGGAGGVLAVVLGVGIAAMFSHASILMLVLGGIVSNALFTSLLSLLKYLADPQDQLPAIVYWLLGSLSAVDTATLEWTGPLLAVAIVAMSRLGRVVDGLSLSDDEASSLGIPVRTLRYALIGLATLICALTVSIAGMVGWVGLLVPHLARLLVGPLNARVLPLSACLGACFMLLADDLARSLTAGEVPLGIITELMGALAFVLVLHRVRRGWA